MSFRQTNIATDANNWPFADVPNTVCVTTTHVMHRKQPILFAFHDSEDGGWQFHADGPKSMRDCLLVCISTVYLHDPTIAEVADLPLGWQASRSAVGQSWTRHQSPPVTTRRIRMTATPNRSLRGFSVRRTPRACHGGCDRLRPGSLRASHAVCLASRTLGPVICARKEDADIESLSTTGKILAESLVMQGDRLFDSDGSRILLHESALHSTSLASELQSERSNG